VRFFPPGDMNYDSVFIYHGLLGLLGFLFRFIRVIREIRGKSLP